MTEKIPEKLIFEESEELKRQNEKEQKLAYKLGSKPAEVDPRPASVTPGEAERDRERFDQGLDNPLKHSERLAEPEGEVIEFPQKPKDDREKPKQAA